MAGLCMKGHFSLASLPVSGKVRGPHNPSSSSSSFMHIITAKATPKLKTTEPEPTVKIFEINGKQIRVFTKADTDSKQIKAPDKADIGRNPHVESRKNVGELGLEEPTLAVGALVRDTLSAEEHTEMGFRGSDNADNDEDPDGEEISMDFDEAEELDEPMDMFVPPGAVMSEEKPLRRLPGSNIYLGPYAKSSRVKEAEFVKSSPSVAECPLVKLPEFAMVGRSNVGKSSLINSLVQRKDLAGTSKKPGKTQLINHFIINKSWYLVDLPGYGYAKVPAKIRASWDGFTKDFFLRSKSLVCVMLLVDGSIPPQQIDLEYVAWLRQNKVPFTIVFTKCDRRKKKKNGGRKPQENVMDFLASLKEQFDQVPPWIMTSCVTNQGKDALLMHMAQLRNYWSS
eukprot:c21429_g1_i1 orf=338-1528(+)